MGFVGDGFVEGELGGGELGNGFEGGFFLILVLLANSCH